MTVESRVTKIGVTATVILATLMIVSTTLSLTNPALAQGPPTIVINLTGDEEVPLATAGANGTLYINIHTEQNPNREIRGQGGNPTVIE